MVDSPHINSSLHQPSPFPEISQAVRVKAPVWGLRSSVFQPLLIIHTNSSFHQPSSFPEISQVVGVGVTVQYSIGLKTKYISTMLVEARPRSTPPSQKEQRSMAEVSAVLVPPASCWWQPSINPLACRVLWYAEMPRKKNKKNNYFRSGRKTMHLIHI